MLEERVMEAFGFAIRGRETSEWSEGGTMSQYDNCNDGVQMIMLRERL